MKTFFAILLMLVAGCGLTVVKTLPKQTQNDGDSVAGECKVGEQKKDSDNCNTCTCQEAQNGKHEWACTLLACTNEPVAKDPKPGDQKPEPKQPELPALPSVEIPSINEKLVKAAKERNYKAMYDLCSEEFKTNNPYDAWAQKMSQKIGLAASAIVGSESLQVSVVNPAASAQLLIHLQSFAGNKDLTLNLKYKNESGAWKINEGLDF